MTSTNESKSTIVQYGAARKAEDAAINEYMEALDNGLRDEEIIKKHLMKIEKARKEAMNLADQLHSPASSV